MSDSDKIISKLDNQLYQFLHLDDPKSFFLFSGAGSGKTRSLVNVLKKIKGDLKKKLLLKGKRVAVITYTNAARDEINDRIEHDNLFFVRTIHSFAWDLIKPYQNDIRDWLNEDTKLRIAEIEKKHAKGRPGSKAHENRIKKLESKKHRLETLSQIKKFTYNPNGDNYSRESVSHSEVIFMCSYFLSENNTMQEILVQKFPILLIDESQDTNRHLIDALFDVQKKKKTKFSLGLFGDMMQRIYADGKVDLGKNLPEDWMKPSKNINHRSPKRIIKLINKIRSYDDNHQQKPRVDKEEGFVRLFIVSNSEDKEKTEGIITKKMVEETGDELWHGKDSDVKTLILEHHMAASRMGFLDLFEPLYKTSKLSTGLLDGSLPEMRFFTKIILPLITAHRQYDDFTISKIITKNTPIFSNQTLKDKDNQLELLKEVDKKTQSLLSLWAEDNDPKLREILTNINSTKILSIPELLKSALEWNTSEDSVDVNSDSFEEIFAFSTSLEAPFKQVEKYNLYINDEAKFGTHQGVKGLQFPRVMVIMDDDESRGFLFSYEKLFNAKSPTKTDRENESEGKETSIQRTRRLFYVTCSRAQKSLAVVAYTGNPDAVKDYVLEQEWFEENEIIEL
ncbi:MAG: UvrD-helicase domain-containing protein [Candidatus Paceibacterota bacterium]